MDNKYISVFMSRGRRRKKSSGGGTPLSTCVRRAAAQHRVRDHQSARCSQLPRAPSRTFVLRGICERRIRKEEGEEEEEEEDEDVRGLPPYRLPPTTPEGRVRGARACALCWRGWVVQLGLFFRRQDTPRLSSRSTDRST